MNSASIMDYMQTIFSFFNAPLFATFLLGMFWKRTSPWGAFIGLVCGTFGAGALFWMQQAGMLHYGSEMAGNFWRSTIAWTICFFVTVLVTFFTKPKPIEELQGLVWGTASPIEVANLPWYKQPAIVAVIVLVFALIFNIIFW